MTTFYLVAAAMVVVALALLGPALLRRQRAGDADRTGQNVAIARERLRDLEAERDDGTLTPAQFEHARVELEQALLDDVEEESHAAAATGAGRWALALLIVLVPAAAASLYAYLGHPAAVQVASGEDPIAAVRPAESAGDQPSIEEMLARVEARLAQAPDDAEGWFILGRSYMTLERYGEAADAFARLYALAGDRPGILLRYADALAMARGGRLSGEPLRLVEKALALDPNDATGLWLAGMGYEEQGDYAKAIAHWQRLEPLIQEDPDSVTEVRGLIARAQRQLGESGSQVTTPSAASVPPPAAPATELRVKVRVAPELADQVDPQATVFVFARALEGPPMPLAAARRSAGELPLEITLDDSMAMMPAMRLSNHAQVRVGARISRSGNAIAQSGDLSGEVQPVAVDGGAPIEVIISRRVP